MDVSFLCVPLPVEELKRVVHSLAYNPKYAVLAKCDDKGEVAKGKP